MLANMFLVLNSILFLDPTGERMHPFLNIFASTSAEMLKTLSESCKSVSHSGNAIYTRYEKHVSSWMSVVAGFVRIDHQNARR